MHPMVKEAQVALLLLLHGSQEQWTMHDVNSEVKLDFIQFKMKKMQSESR